MTISEHFQQFFKRVRYGAVGTAVVLILLDEWLYHPKRGLETFIHSFGGGLLIAAVLFVLLKRAFVCPRCGADFAQLRRQQLGRFNFDKRMYWELWDKCPQCGVRFDEPYEPFSG